MTNDDAVSESGEPSQNNLSPYKQDSVSQSSRDLESVESARSELFFESLLENEENTENLSETRSTTKNFSEPTSSVDDFSELEVADWAASSDFRLSPSNGDDNGRNGKFLSDQTQVQLSSMFFLLSHQTTAVDNGFVCP